MNPSNTPGTTTGVERKNSTFERLYKWFDYAGVRYFSFVNTTDKRGEVTVHDIDWKTLGSCVEGYDVVFAMGGFASCALKKLNISHRVLPHPSPRNRSFNDPTYEPRVMRELKKIMEKTND